MEYSDYANVFSSNLTIKLSENTSINKYVFELVKSQQPLYGSIYALSSVELETLKTYIKPHLKTGFIQSFKSHTGVPILFDKKPNGSFPLCTNYQGLNNLTIKNWYPLLWIDESLDWLSWIKCFIQLDLTGIYY